MLGVYFVFANQFKSVETLEDPTIERLMSQWKAAGLAVGAIYPAADPLGAARAAEADVNGKPVTVYQFDPLNAAQLKTLDKIKAEGTVVIDGKKVSALVNGPFVLARYEDHPDKETLIKTFQGFGTFEGDQGRAKARYALASQPFEILPPCKRSALACVRCRG